MALQAPGLYSRVAAMLPELLKFGIVGGLGTVIDLGGAAVLHSKYHVEPLAAKAVSVTLATFLTYLGSRFWTFKERENQSVGREAALFLVLNLAGLLIAEAVIGPVTYVMGLRGSLEYNAASFVGTGFGTMFRFWAYRRWVFLAPEQGSGAASPLADTPAFPDYPPWELDPAFLAPVKVAAPVPAMAPSYSSPWAQPTAPALNQAPARNQARVSSRDEPPLYSWEPTEHLPQPEDSAPRRTAGRHRRS